MALFKDILSKISDKRPEPHKEDRHTKIGESAESAEKLFEKFNRSRRTKLREQIGERAFNTLTALPFLLHTNCEGLPGYQEGSTCPTGITGFEPTAAEYENVQKLFPDATPRRMPVFKMAVDLVAVMGSAGSVGFTESSDLDIWICFRLSENNRLGLELLRQKALEIEEWMNRYSGVEVHLFVQPTEHIRENNFGKTDIEGCGSALGALLKEEFYRTAIVLAGRPPLWWVIPPGQGAESYPLVHSNLAKDETFDSTRFVDLGVVDQVVLGELFGAAIWQIAKGQKSPFKSALKMGYLEKTVCGGTDSLPLCELLKSKVLNGETPDPYGLLFDEVLRYYSDNNDLAAQELLAECFYLKTGATIDPEKLDLEPGEETERIIREYVIRWGWGKRKLKRLNDFSTWRFEWLMELSNEVDRFFLRSYRRIYEALEKAGMASSITDRDLTVIGRTLQVAYRQTPNKISRIHLIAGGAKETVLSLIEALLPSGEVEWRLYRGVVNALNEEEMGRNLLSKFSDVVESLIWAARNGVMGDKTRLLAKPIDRRFSSADLESVSQMIVAFIGEGDKDSHQVEDLLSDPVPLRMFLVPNLGSEENEVVDLSALYQTSWGETFYRRFTGSGAYGALVTGELTNFWTNAPDPSRITVYVPKRKVSSLTSPGAKFQKGLSRMHSLFCTGIINEREVRRYITTTAEGFASVERDSKGFSFKNFTSMDHLMRYLAGVGPLNQIVTKIDEDHLLLAELSLVFTSAERGRVNIFVVERPKIPEIYVIDEIGNFFQTSCDDVNSIYTLSKLKVFLDFTLPEIRQQRGNPLSAAPLTEMIRIFKLSVEPSLRVYPATNDYLRKVEELGLRPMGLTIERMQQEGNSAGYKIIWGEEIIQSGQVDHPLMELKNRITKSRSSEKEYGVYVTKLFLDEQFLKKNCGSFATTCHYLFYKAAVEQRLNS